MTCANKSRKALKKPSNYGDRMIYPLAPSSGHMLGFFNELIYPLYTHAQETLSIFSQTASTASPSGQNKVSMGIVRSCSKQPLFAWQRQRVKWIRGQYPGGKCSVSGLSCRITEGWGQCSNRHVERAARVKSHDGIGWSQGRVHGNAFNYRSLWEKNWNFIISN